jgi:hypothetical protein
MNLQDEENVIKVFHHHPTTFFIKAVNYLIVSLPFYFMGYLISTALNKWQAFGVYAVITAIFGFLIFYDLMLFFLDHLIITNRRIIHVDWKSAFSRTEAEAELLDIQDITTKEMGVFSALKMFDYGIFTLETASTKTSIIFADAPDPEGIKHFIYRLYQKPSRIESASNVSSVHDTARQIPEEEAAATRRQ